MSASEENQKAKPWRKGDKRKMSLPTSLAYRIRTFGRIYNQPYHSTPGTHGGDAMLTVVRSGKGQYLRANMRVDVTGGMIGLVLPGDDVGVLMADTQEPYDHYYCRFSGNQAIDVAKRIVALHDQQPFFILETWQAVLDCIEQLHVMLSHRVNYTHLEDSHPPTPADGVLGSLLAYLEIPTPSVMDKQMTASRLNGYLNDHLAEPFSLEQMADYFEISKEHLCRLAKVCLNGQTLGVLAEQMKIQWACVLLREGQLRITDVARRVGYLDPLYFSKVFKKHMLQSPRQWRESQ